MSLGPDLWPFLGGPGGISSVGDRVCRLGTQLAKTFRTREKSKKTKNYFWLRFQREPFFVKTERLGPLVPPMGAVRTAKT